MKKIILQYDKYTGNIYDSNGIYVASMLALSYEEYTGPKHSKISTKEIVELKQSGFSTSEIKELSKEGLI